MDENATSYKVSDLSPYTTYTFSVSATTKAGAGPPIIVSSTTSRRAQGEVLCFVFFTYITCLITTPQYQISFSYHVYAQTLTKL